jgi:hypothetical protein
VCKELRLQNNEKTICLTAFDIDMKIDSRKHVWKSQKFLLEIFFFILKYKWDEGQYFLGV